MVYDDGTIELRQEPLSYKTEDTLPGDHIRPFYGVSFHMEGDMRSGIIRHLEANMVSDEEIDDLVKDMEKGALSQIMDTIRENWDIIQALPERLRNGTKDGSNNIFTFATKEISAANIHRSDEDYVYDNPHRLSETDCAHLLYANKVLDIYDEIAAALSSYDLIHPSVGDCWEEPGFSKGFEDYFIAKNPAGIRDANW